MVTDKSSRPLELARASWGLALALAPRAVLQDVHHLRVDESSLTIVRILGARQVAQSVLSGVRPSPEVLAMGVWVDTTHAVTALGLAFLDPGRARAGLIDCAAASIWAWVGYRDLVHAPATPASHDRRRDRLARLVLDLVPGGSPLAARARRGVEARRR